jgi:hypothetical protein
MDMGRRLQDDGGMKPLNSRVGQPLATVSAAGAN